ncbi:MAG: LuxR C-terminal-related transcriptional regulator [Lentisphaerales bacterium]|nr:LuxR C-terminal-related transcriptional regulator [Lentisphaerales bacterium]
MNICERRRFFFDNFIPLLGATSYIWYESVFDPSMRAPMTLNYLTNFNPVQQHLFFEASNDSKLIDPYMIPSIVHRTTNNVDSYLRQECLDDETWYNSEYCNKYYKAADIDNPLCYMISQKDNQMCGILIFSKWRQEKFTLKHRQIIESVFKSLPWLFPDKVMIDPTPFFQLTPQLYKILSFLVNGNDKAEIAAYLGISEHTVIDYSKQIYTFFKVKSYGELINLFIH